MIHHQVRNLAISTFVLLLGTSSFIQAQNNCLNFDGIGDEVDLGNMTALDNVSAITLEAWVRVDSWNNFKPIIGQTDNSTASLRLIMGGVQGRIIGLVGNGTNAQGWTNSTSALPLNTWTHIAMVYNGSAIGNGNKLKLYVNGTSQALIFQSAIPATTATIASPFHICEAANSTSSNFDGKVDEVRIWTAALSANTIDDWNNIPVTTEHPNYGALESYYMMDDPLTPLVLADSAGTANGAIDNATYNPNDNEDFCYPPHITDVSVDPTCFNTNDGSIILTTTGLFSPYTYSWANGNLTDTNSGIAGGTYDVTITDDWGCDYEESYVLNTPPAIDITSTITHVDCFGDADGSISSVSNGGTGNHSYVWSNSQTTASISGLVAGTYYLSVTDSTGCEAIDTAEVMQPDVISITFDSVKHVTCAGDMDGTATISVDGGTTPYAYAWSDNTQSGSVAMNLLEGVLFVTVTDDNGCTNTEGATISHQFALPIVDLGPNVTPSSFPIQLTPGPNFTSYLWSTGSSISTISVSGIGEYWVECTDSNTCMNRDTIKVKKAVGLNTISSETDLYWVYPNPSTGQFTIGMPNSNNETMEAKVYTIAGNLISSTPVKHGSILDLSHHAAGLYFLELRGSHGQQTIRLVVE